MTDPSSMPVDSHFHSLGEAPELSRVWWVALLSGALNLVAGLVVLIEPHTSLLAIALVLGIYLVIVGIVTLVGAVMENPVQWLGVALGIAAVVAGGFVIARPGSAVRGVLVVFGIYLVLAGCVHVVVSIAGGRGTGAEMLRGLLDIAAGAVFLAAPKLGLTALALFIGLYLLVRAVIELVLAWVLYGLRASEEPGQSATG